MLQKLCKANLTVTHATFTNRRHAVNVSPLLSESDGLLFQRFINFINSHTRKTLINNWVAVIVFVLRGFSKSLTVHMG